MIKTLTFEYNLKEDNTLTLLRVWKDKDGIEHYQIYKGCKLRTR